MTFRIDTRGYKYLQLTGLAINNNPGASPGKSRARLPKDRGVEPRSVAAPQQRPFGAGAPVRHGALVRLNGQCISTDQYSAPTLRQY